MIDAKTAVHLKRLIRNYAESEVELSWIGIADPEDHDEIRANHRNAKEKLFAMIDSLTERKPVMRE